MPTANGARFRIKAGAGRPRWMLVGCRTLTADGVMNPILGGRGYPSSPGDGRPTTTVVGSAMADDGTGVLITAMAASATGEHFTEAVVMAALLALDSIPGDS